MTRNMLRYVAPKISVMPDLSSPRFELTKASIGNHFLGQIVKEFETWLADQDDRGRNTFGSA